MKPMQSNPKQKCGLGQNHNLQPKYGIRFKILIFENHIKFHSKFKKKSSVLKSFATILTMNVNSILYSESNAIRSKI